MNEKDLKKHKYDVFRLLQIVQNDARIETNGLVRKSILEYLDIILDENAISTVNKKSFPYQ